MDRIYRKHTDWEEIKHNMWGTVENRDKFLKAAIKFTSDHRKYGRFMVRVIKEWPVSCENALTDTYINRKAWIGHAACALALECPEDIVREAWGKLTGEQQFLANKEAERAIQAWELSHIKDNKLHKNMGETLL